MLDITNTYYIFTIKKNNQIIIVRTTSNKYAQKVRDTYEVISEITITGNMFKITCPEKYTFITTKELFSK